VWRVVTEEELESKDDATAQGLIADVFEPRSQRLQSFAGDGVGRSWSARCGLSRL
jgi:hypothetical protein